MEKVYEFELYSLFIVLSKLMMQRIENTYIYIYSSLSLPGEPKIQLNFYSLHHYNSRTESRAAQNNIYIAMITPVIMYRYETWFALENDKVIYTKYIGEESSEGVWSSN